MKQKTMIYLWPAVMVTFSWGRDMAATLEAVKILVSDSLEQTSDQSE